MQPESIRPCTGHHGHYEMWSQYAGLKGVVSERVRLHRTMEVLEDELGIPDVPNPDALLTAANEYSSSKLGLGEDALPAVSTLVRACYRANHADYAHTRGARMRLELVQRVVWVPQRVSRVAIAGCMINSEGAGRVLLPGRRTDELAVSAPLLAAEERYALSRGGPHAIRTVLSYRSAPTIYALLHEGLDGEPIERPYTPESANVS